MLAVIIIWTPPLLTGRLIMTRRSLVGLHPDWGYRVSERHARDPGHGSSWLGEALLR